MPVGAISNTHTIAYSYQVLFEVVSVRLTRASLITQEFELVLCSDVLGNITFSDEDAIEFAMRNVMIWVGGTLP